MAKDQGVKAPPDRRARPAPRVAVAKASPANVVAAPVVAKPKRKTTAAQFTREVRGEARKISWPSWKETWITSVMVFIMVVVTSLFFFVTDGALSLFMQQLLKLAG